MSDATATAAPAAAPTPEPATASTAAPAAAPAAAPTAAPAPAAAPAAAPAVDTPIEYTDFTVPEGFTKDEAVLGEFKTMAQGLKLPQAEAQKLIDLHGKVSAAGQKQAMVNTEAFYADIGGMPDKWADTAKADKEFGGDKFDENLAVAKTAIDKFGTPELTTLLTKTNIGSHPELLRAFYRIGKAITPDGFVPGRAGASGATAQGMFSKSNMNP